MNSKTNEVLQQISRNAFSDEIKKVAGLDVGNIEDDLGVYLNDATEEQARNLIDQRKKQSFGLRHPFLTGIPTFGIWPAISRENAIDFITRKLMRSNPDLKSEVLGVQAAERADEFEQMKAQAALDTANQGRNTVIAAMPGALGGLAMYLNNRAPNQE